MSPISEVSESILPHAPVPLVQLLQIINFAVQYFGWKFETSNVVSPEVLDLNGHMSNNFESQPRLEALKVGIMEDQYIGSKFEMYESTPDVKVNPELEQLEAIKTSLDSAGHNIDRLSQEVTVREAQLSAIGKKLDKLNKQLNSTQFAVNIVNKEVNNLVQHIQTKHVLLQILPAARVKMLLDAAATGNLSTLNNLLQIGTSPSSRDKDGYTALHMAARHGQVEAAEILLEAGIDLEITTNWKWTSLHEAALYGQTDFCFFLLNWGAKVNVYTTYNSTPLHFAAEYGHLSVVQLLVHHGADIQGKDKSGHTPLKLAFSSGKRDVAEWLARQ